MLLAFFSKHFETYIHKKAYTYKNIHKRETRLLVSGRSPECSDCLLRFMEQ